MTGGECGNDGTSRGNDVGAALRPTCIHWDALPVNGTVE